MHYTKNPCPKKLSRISVVYEFKMQKFQACSIFLHLLLVSFWKPGQFLLFPLYYLLVTPSVAKSTTQRPSLWPTNSPSPSSFVTEFPTPQPETVLPTQMPASEYPTPRPRTNQPTPKPSTESPTLSPQTAPPTPTPSTQSPTFSPQTARPTPTPSTESPSLSPQTAPPTPTPRTKNPTPTPSTVSPSLSPQTTPPTPTPSTESPTLSPQTTHPTPTPRTRPHTTTTQTKRPTGMPETKSPTGAPQTKPHTTTPRTKPPTFMPQTKSPSQMPRTESPTLALPTNISTRRPQTEPPTPTPSTKPPTPMPPTELPTPMPSTKPRIPRPQNKPPIPRPPTKPRTPRPLTKPPTRLFIPNSLIISSSPSTETPPPTSKPSTKSSTPSPQMQPLTTKPLTKSATLSPEKGPTIIPESSTQHPEAERPTSKPFSKPPTRSPTNPQIHWPTTNTMTPNPEMERTPWLLTKPHTPQPEIETQNPTSTSRPETEHPAVKTWSNSPTPSPEIKPTTSKPKADHSSSRPDTKSPTTKPETKTPSTITSTESPTPRPDIEPPTLMPNESRSGPTPSPLLSSSSNSPLALVMPTAKETERKTPSQQNIPVLMNDIQSSSATNKPTSSQKADKSNNNPNTSLVSRPSNRKTIKPQAVNSIIPTYKPMNPTSQPTQSVNPSTFPSAQPSLPLQVGPKIKNVAMVFDDCKSLGGVSISKWENITAKFVRSDILKRADERSILFLDVALFFRKQVVPVEQEGTTGNETSKANHNATKSERYLQGFMSPLAIFFDLQIKLRSPIVNHPYESYFTESLNTKEKTENYINQLQISGDPVFNTINSLKVLIDGRDITQESKIKTPIDSTQPSNIGIYIGIAVGILIVAVITIVFITFASKKEIETEECCDDVEIKSAEEDAVYITVPTDGVDVSTLGAPIENWKSCSEKCEDPTVGESTIKHGYEYQKYITGVLHSPEIYAEKKTSENIPDNATMIHDKTAGSSGFQCSQTLQHSTAESAGDPLPEQKFTLDTADDVDAISCDEGSFDDHFKSPETALHSKSDGPSVNGVTESDTPPVLFDSDIGNIIGKSGEECTNTHLLNPNRGGLQDNDAQGQSDPFPKQIEKKVTSPDDVSCDDHFLSGKDHIELTAPPGKLGIQIDTSSSGFPIVYGIREDSPLVGLVCIGDILVSVDGESVTKCPAAVISSIINARANNLSRVLEFVRNKNGL